MIIIKSFSFLSQHPLQRSVLAEKASQDEKIIIQFLTSKSEKLASTRMAYKICTKHAAFI